jgi:hypothetical protein
MDPNRSTQLQYHFNYMRLHTMRIGHEDDGIFDNSDEFVSEYDLPEHVSQLK